MQLNSKQRKAAYELSGNTLITASPGSGKTKTLIARAMHKLEIIPKYKTIALITYTNAGADEISSRLIDQKNLFIGTIHSFCLEHILRPFGWIYNWTRPRVISYEEKQTFFEENVDLEEELDVNKFEELNKIKKSLDGNLDFNIQWDHAIELKDIASRYYEYQNNLKVIDFNEILYRSYKIIIENEFVAKSLASKFFEILVDEFQDTNLYQYEILKSINHHKKCTFFMVGDDKQKIFSFAGAIENAIERAKIDFNAQLETLTETYRSTNAIVKAYSKLFKDHPVIENKSLNANLDIEVSFFQTKNSNHQNCLKAIVKQLIEKYNIELSEIAILSTSWYTAFPASKALREDYNVVGLGALPHKSISNSTVSLLKSLSKYRNSPNLRTLRSIKYNIELHLLETGLILSEDEFHKITNTLISKFLKIPLNKTLKDGIVHIKKLFNQTFEKYHSTFDEILDLIPDDGQKNWNINRYLEALAGVNGIINNTIHKVKGSEFDAVILNQMNENKIPYQKLLCRKSWIYQKLTIENIEDGRNLFYVGVSRAKKYLIILHNWKPSLFIEIINK